MLLSALEKTLVYFILVHNFCINKIYKHSLVCKLTDIWQLLCLYILFVWKWFAHLNASLDLVCEYCWTTFIRVIYKWYVFIIRQCWNEVSHVLSSQFFIFLSCQMFHSLPEAKGCRLFTCSVLVTSLFHLGLWHAWHCFWDQCRHHAPTSGYFPSSVSYSRKRDLNKSNLMCRAELANVTSCPSLGFIFGVCIL